MWDASRISTSAEVFRRGFCGSGNLVKVGPYAPSTETSNRALVIDCVTETRPFEVQRRRHSSIRRESVAPVRVRVDWEICSRIHWRVRRNPRQAVEQRAWNEAFAVK